MRTNQILIESVQRERKKKRERTRGEILLGLAPAEENERAGVGVCKHLFHLALIRS